MDFGRILESFWEDFGENLVWILGRNFGCIFKGRAAVTAVAAEDSFECLIRRKV